MTARDLGGGGVRGRRRMRWTELRPRVEVRLELEDARKLVGVKVGDLVWRTQHAALQRQLKGALSDKSAGRALVDVALDGSLGEPLRVTVTDGRGRSASAETDEPLQAATSRPLDEARSPRPSDSWAAPR